MAVQIEERRSVWDTPITSLIAFDWEKIILVLLLVLALVTRFWDLGARSYNHDESIHTDWAHNLYTGKGYIHDPIYHGPLLYHLTAAAFFLFGDNDVTARVPNVVFGIILIALPFFFRKWLGRRGWIVTSLILLISPVVTYYSRFNRHDIYVEVFVVLMLLAIMKYLDARTVVDGNVEAARERGTRWLYAAAAILAFSFTAMETTFIFTALFAYFLTGVFAYDWLNKTERLGDGRYNAIFACILGLPIFVGYLLYFTLWKILSRFGITGEPEPTWREIPAFDFCIVIGTLSMPLVLTPLFVQVVLGRNALDYSTTGSIFSTSVVFIASIVLSALIGMLWNWRKWLICALLFYPIMLFFFTTVFTNPAGIGTGFIGSLGYWLTQQPVARGTQPEYYYLLVTLPLYEYLPYFFGLLGLVYILYKRSEAAMWWFLSVVVALLALVFYVWFTPGTVDWLVEHVFMFSKFLHCTAGDGGKQVCTPDLLGAANATVLFLLLLIPIFFLLSYDPDDPRTRFPTMIGIWALGTLILFSWAGEKMPWLTMHLTIPLAFVTGYFMQRVLRANWRPIYEQGGLLLALLLALGLLTLAFQVLFGPAPLQGTPLDDLAKRSSVLISMLIVALCGGLVFYLGTRLGAKNALRLTLLTLFVILALFTIHSTSLAAYKNSDVAVETIIYAQGTPDVPIAMREIDELSRRLCAQTSDTKPKINCDNNTIKVAYDDESSWPFVWYLRNYRNAQYYGKTPGQPFDAEVVIVGPTNEPSVKSFLGNRYVRRQMRLIWWPNEYYKDLSWAKLFGGTDSNGTQYIFSDPTGKDTRSKSVLGIANLPSLVRDIWFYHKYPESLSQWPYVHTFAMYVRRDITSLLWQYSGVVAPPQINPEEDPYTKNFVQGLQAQASIGAAGVSNAEFNGPRNLTLDAQGNMYVVDSNNHRVEKFTANGQFVLAWGGQGSEPGQFNEPWGIAVDKQSNVYVADTWNHRIQKFDANGTFLLEWGTHGDAPVATDNPDQFYGPRAIALDADGNLWVTDTGNKRVLKFDPQGKPLAQFGGAGADPGQFSEPVGLAIDDKGNIYVADTWNQRIQKFDKDFTPLQQWPVEAWDTQSVVNKPYLAVDTSGNVYATDPEGYRILKFTTEGKLTAVWGTKGTDLATFNLPVGIAIAPDGKIYVADSGNNRILVFGPVKQ